MNTYHVIYHLVAEQVLRKAIVVASNEVDMLGYLREHHDHETVVINSAIRLETGAVVEA